MLDDLGSGKRLEFNDLSSAAVRLGLAMGVDTPVHAMIQAALQLYDGTAMEGCEEGSSMAITSACTRRCAHRRSAPSAPFRRDAEIVA